MGRNREREVHYYRTVRRRVLDNRRAAAEALFIAPLCECGCGESVHWEPVKNRWSRYIRGHVQRGRGKPALPLPYCACGCGERVNNKKCRYRGDHFKHIQMRQKLERLGEAPYCECGCGEKVSLEYDGRRWNRFINTHQFKYFGSQEFRKRMSELMNSPEMRERLSRISKDNFKNAAYVKKLRLGTNRRPNSFEMIIDLYTPDFVEYVGDSKLWVKFSNGRSKNPDFHAGGKKVIECHGDYWHRGQDASELIALYKEVGYDCLVIWESELDDFGRVIERLEGFLDVDEWQPRLL